MAPKTRGKEIGARRKPTDDPWRGNRIRDLMEALGYGLHGGITRLTQKLGLKERKTLYRWMDGEEMLPANLERLAEELDSSPRYILTGTGPRFNEHPPSETLRRGRGGDEDPDASA